jgi:pilus assembly protein Flp/PilA
MMLKGFTYVAARLSALRSDEKGVTALEYGVIAAVTIVVGLAAFSTIGGLLDSTFGSISSSLQSSTGGGG